MAGMTAKNPKMLLCYAYWQNDAVFGVLDVDVGVGDPLFENLSIRKTTSRFEH